MEKDVAELKVGGWTPRLLSVSVGDCEPSRLYIRNQRRAAEKHGTLCVYGCLLLCFYCVCGCRVQRARVSGAVSCVLLLCVYLCVLVVRCAVYYGCIPPCCVSLLRAIAGFSRCVR